MTMVLNPSLFATMATRATIATIFAGWCGSRDRARGKPQHDCFMMNYGNLIRTGVVTVVGGLLWSLLSLSSRETSHQEPAGRMPVPERMESFDPIASSRSDAPAGEDNIAS